ncbi:MAG: hypothetical protein ACRDTG_09885 [Pseudonocardiaceae bacterium]
MSVDDELEHIASQLAEIDRTLDNSLGVGMVPAPPRLAAVYGPNGCRAAQVVAFDERGPLVVGESGRLCPARDLSHFVGLIPDRTSIVSIIPGGGWRVEFTDDGVTWSEPVVGWALLADGTVVALDTDSLGEVGVVRPESRGRHRIWHPDADQTSGLGKEPLVDGG